MTLLTQRQAAEIVRFPGVYCPPPMDEMPRKRAPLWAVALAGLASLPVVWLAVKFMLTMLNRFAP